MSTPQTNFENNNNRLANYAKNIDNILGYVLLYSVIIFTTISALLGGTVIYPIYLIIYIFNKTREIKEIKENEIAEAEEANEIADDKKPIIDENWCNVSLKNIINYTNEVVEEEEVLSLKKPLSEDEESEEEEESEDEEEQNEIEVEDNSPNDKYSCHYKPEPIDFNN
jgi:hypothetical protein